MNKWRNGSKGEKIRQKPIGGAIRRKKGIAHGLRGCVKKEKNRQKKVRENFHFFK